MSTFLAIGAVSAVLRSLIGQSMSPNRLATILGTLPEVSALPPDRIEAGQQNNSDRVNLFLFQATENAAWRNMDLPSRNGRGERAANPKLALDLHYLVTAHGATDFRAEVLLGYAMYVFHETPVLTRQAIRDALAALPPGSFADALADARVADQFEQIKIVPRAASVEEVSKIWTALKAQYRTTAVYDVSVVLIEADRGARSALPVLTRGRPVPGGRDEGVFVHAGLLPPVPTLESLVLPAGAPAVRLGEALTLRGHHLAGNQTRARFRPVRDTGALELAAAAGAGDGGFDVQLPPDPPVGPVTPTSPLNPDNWRAGVYEVSAVTEQGGQLRESNRLPVVLAPRINSVTTSAPAGQLLIEVTCSPPVRPTQSVVLVVGTRELLPEPFTLPSSTLTFPAPDPPDALPSGQQWVRLRVDGVESLLVNYSAKPPAFQASQSVVIP